ncbi:unnamed protein product, partial [Rotaria sp. Silwood1]
ASITKQSLHQYQYLGWEALKKTINDEINKINESNFSLIISELFKNNILRARGLFAHAIILTQTISPFNTHIYVALICLINSELPQIVELIIKRLILSFESTYKLIDTKSNCLSTLQFLAYLINENVLHAIIAFQILIRLLENSTNNTVELASEFLKHCGHKLSQVNPQGLYMIFSKLTNLLDKSSLDQRSQNMIKVLFALEKDQFKTNPPIKFALDFVDKNKPYTHLFTLDYPYLFEYDEQYEFNEEQYKEIQEKILTKLTNNKIKDNLNETEKETISDQIETNIFTFRRTIYSIIESSVSAEVCLYQLFRMNLSSEQEMELCQMIINMCVEQRTYERFFSLLAQKLCLLKHNYVECFENIFQYQYKTIHILPNNKIKIVVQFFAHLLLTDAIMWHVFSCINIIKERVAISSRIYIENLFVELIVSVGLKKLNNRLRHPTLVKDLEGLFPRNNLQNILVCRNFFTSINLSGLMKTKKLIAHANWYCRLVSSCRPNDDTNDPRLNGVTRRLDFRKHLAYLNKENTGTRIQQYWTTKKRH